jgi:uncharacterized membrane protein YvlD (DUF360 family)
VQPIALTVFARAVIAASMVYGFGAAIWLAVFLAMGNGFIQRHVNNLT